MSSTFPNPDDLVQRGQGLFRAGKFPEAADCFQEASQEYSTHGDELMAAEAANNCSVASLKSGDARRALAAALRTDLTFEKAGDTYRQALALGNQATANEVLGNLREALNGYQRSSELLKNSHHPEERSYVLKSLSMVQMKLGDQLGSFSSMSTALDNKSGAGIKDRLLKKLLEVPFRMLGRKG